MAGLILETSTKKTSRQKNISQMREQEKSQKKLNEMQANNLSDIEFEVIVIRMRKDIEIIKRTSQK